MISQTFTITPQGPFSLAEAATFGFGQRSGQEWDGVMRLAFCADGYTRQVGVEVRQDNQGLVHCTVIDPAGSGSPASESSSPAGPSEPAGELVAVQGQVARVLSLDRDGEEFTRIGERDPVIGKLQQAAPGLRPPLFYSPYEAAAWSVLSARRPARQMMTVRDRLSAAHGASCELAGHASRRFPYLRRYSRSSPFLASRPRSWIGCTGSRGRHSKVSSTPPNCCGSVLRRQAPSCSASRASVLSIAR